MGLSGSEVAHLYIYQIQIDLYSDESHEFLHS